MKKQSLLPFLHLSSPSSTSSSRRLGFGIDVRGANSGTSKISKSVDKSLACVAITKVPTRPKVAKRNGRNINPHPPNRFHHQRDLLGFVSNPWFFSFSHPSVLPLGGRTERVGRSKPNCVREEVEA